MKIPTNKRDIHAYLAGTKKIKRIEVRMPVKLLEAAQEFADKRGWGLSYTLRYLIAIGVSKG